MADGINVKGTECVRVDVISPKPLLKLSLDILQSVTKIVKPKEVNMYKSVCKRLRCTVIWMFVILFKNLSNEKPP